MSSKRLSLILLIYLLPALAVGSSERQCRQVFLNVSEAELKTALRRLAELTVELDVADVQDTSSLALASLKQDQPRKEKQLAAFFEAFYSMGSDEFREVLRKEVEEVQGESSPGRAMDSRLTRKALVGGKARNLELRVIPKVREFPNDKLTYPTSRQLLDNDTLLVTDQDRLVTTSLDSQVQQIYNRRKLLDLTSLSVYAPLVVSPDRHWAFANSASSIVRFDLTDPSQPAERTKSFRTWEYLNEMQISPDGQYLLLRNRLSQKASFQIYSTKTMKKLFEEPDQEEFKFTTSFSRTGRYALVNLDNGDQIIVDLSNMTRQRISKEPQNWRTQSWHDAQFLGSTDQIIFRNPDSKLMVYNIETEEYRDVWQGPAHFRGFRVSSDGKRALVYGKDFQAPPGFELMMILDLATGNGNSVVLPPKWGTAEVLAEAPNLDKFILTARGSDGHVLPSLLHVDLNSSTAQWADFDLAKYFKNSHPSPYANMGPTGDSFVIYSPELIYGKFGPSP